MKVLASVWFVFVVACFPRRSVWAFGVAGLCLVAGFVVAGLSGAQVIRRLSVLVSFVPVVVAIPFLAGGSQVEVIGLSLSVEGIWGAWNFVAKAAVGVSVSVMLTATTTVPDILAGLGKLGAPKILVAIASSMVRYLDLVTREISRTRVAMVSRGYSPSWLWQMKPLAASVGALFIRSYERSERVHAAMLARGFTGTMPAQNISASPNQWLWVCCAPALMTFVLIVAVIR